MRGSMCGGNSSLQPLLLPAGPCTAPPDGETTSCSIALSASGLGLDDRLLLRARRFAGAVGEVQRQTGREIQLRRSTAAAPEHIHQTVVGRFQFRRSATLDIAFIGDDPRGVRPTPRSRGGAHRLHRSCLQAARSDASSRHGLRCIARSGVQPFPEQGVIHDVPIIVGARGKSEEDGPERPNTKTPVRKWKTAVSLARRLVLCVPCRGPSACVGLKKDTEARHSAGRIRHENFFVDVS